MADERDPKVSAAYRALGADEPPRALDDAILAAARAPRISPARPWAQRWAVPLSLAAVVVLSVVVTLRVQHEQPEIVSAEAPPAAPPAARPAEQPLRLKTEDQLMSAAKPAPKLEARRAEPKPFADARSDRAPAAAGAGVVQAPAAAPPPPAPPGELASRGAAGRAAEMAHGDSALRREEERVARDAEAAARAPQAAAALAKRSAAEQAPKPAAVAAAKPAPAPAVAQATAPAAKLAAETPEQEFERIAQLRREGRHEEADKAFLEFRRRYPDFKITDDMLRRVERR